MAQASAEKLEHAWLAEKKRMASVPQSEQLARTPEPLLPKGKEQSHLSLSPDRQKKDSESEREPHLGEKGGPKREHGAERVDSTVKKGRLQGGEGEQTKKSP